MKNSETISIRDLGQRASDLVNRARYGKEVFKITKRVIHSATLIPPDFRCHECGAAINGESNSDSVKKARKKKSA